MAELVHLRLEYSLPELEEMQRIKLFSPEEIRGVVKKRKAFEYKLRRKNKLKEDFLKYIEFEMNLLSLIGKRRERLLCEDKKKEIDDSIAKRINRLFKAVTSRFQEDEKLFLDQIQFCKKMRWYELINSLHTKMLQIHSKSPSLWVLAAKWEMEEARLPENARKLLQRGVLLNPHSELLWREYYRMELMYEDLIRKRKAILEPQNIKEMETEEDDVVLRGEVARIVYDKAMEEFNDLEYALSFIQICLEFEFGSKHIDYILKDVQERFPDKEEVFDAIAQKPLLNVEEQIKIGKQSGIKKRHTMERINMEICKKYEEAVDTCSTEKMWSMYIDYALGYLNSIKEGLREELQEFVTKLMERAAAENCLSVSYYSNYVTFLMERGDEEVGLTEVLKAARKFNSPSLWLRCLSEHVHWGKPSNLIYDLLLESVNTVHGKDSIELWYFGVNWLSAYYPEKLIEYFEVGIKKKKQISFALKEMYLEATALQKGIDDTRLLYKKFKKIGPLSVQIIKKMIQIEKGQLNVSVNILRQYYEDGIKEFGSSCIEIWVDYLQMEQSLGDPSSYGTLYWRAKKNLDADHLQEFHARVVDFTTGSNVHSSILLSAQ